MPAATPLGIRQQIIEDKLQGKSSTDIARDRKLSYSTVCNIWALHRTGQSLVPKYRNCGIKKTRFSMLVYRAGTWLKRLHPDWGAPFIKLKLQERYPDEQLPHSRSMQRWFKKAGLNKVRGKIPRGERHWAGQVHETWQVDAKEQLVLSDGQKACYLTMVDEKSGGLLNARAFPPIQDK